VVAPETSPAFASFIARNAFDWRPRKFERDDVNAYWLVVTATGDRAVDSRGAAAGTVEAHAAGLTQRPVICAKQV